MPKASLRAAIAVCALLGLLAGSRNSSAATNADCEALGQLSFGSRAKVLSAESVDTADGTTERSWLPSALKAAITQVPSFCRVVLLSTPSAESRIGIEVWMPLSRWNGRLMGTGSGGYPLGVNYEALIDGVKAGFAVSNTDLGLAAHIDSIRGPDGQDVTTLFIGHPVRLVDFGSRATHEMTLLSKQLAARFYGRPTKRSYFIGCSTGGMQALREVEQFPEDYDGVVAGDPGENRARVHLEILWNFLSVWHKPQRVLTHEQLAAMHVAAVKACEGTARASYIEAPLACDWNPASLLCGKSSGVCLTQEQVDAADLIYGGPRNPRTGERYYPGLTRGSELGWEYYMKQANDELPFRGVFAFALGNDVRFENFDWDRDADTFIAAVGPYIDATNSDFSAFRRRGGKLILYHGGSDPLASAQDTADLFGRVIARDRTSGGGVETSAYALMFVMPGMDHCRGGSGPDHFDQVAAIQQWTERDMPPVPLSVTKADPTSGDAIGLLCPYLPQMPGGSSSMNSRGKTCRLSH